LSPPSSVDEDDPQDADPVRGQRDLPALELAFEEALARNHLDAAVVLRDPVLHLDLGPRGRLAQHPHRVAPREQRPAVAAVLLHHREVDVDREVLRHEAILSLLGVEW